MGFHKPKKDRCETCIFLQNSKETDEEKVDQLNEEYREHQVNKTMARYLKNSYELNVKENKKMCVAFDLQKVLIEPYGDHALFYYKRNLSIYNLTLCNLVTKQGYCCVWDQTIAKRGSNEVSSCLYNYVNSEIP